MALFLIAAGLLRISLHVDMLSDKELWQVLCSLVVLLFHHLSASEDRTRDILDDIRLEYTVDAWPE